MLQTALKFFLLILSIIFFGIANLFVGSVNIPPGEVVNILTGGSSTVPIYEFIILDSRLPQAITAIIAGAGLSASGLLLQTAFHNPLASPSLLGISSGASLGVAIVTLLTGGTIAAAGLSAGGYIAIMTAAFAGSMGVMALLLLLSNLLKNDLMLLITGVLLGYLVSSVITLLNYQATADGIQSYVMWGMGTFSSVPPGHLAIFGGVTALGLATAILLVKPLNIIQLGSSYARNLGINLNYVRNLLLASTGILTAVVTAYCGPVSFIGLAVPHIARLIFPTGDHRVLMPATILTGCAVALLCNILCVLPSASVLPLNSVTPLIGVPVIIFVILSRRK
ncbi:MAG: iron ABC transporter permease [Paramuribaculum sp.]|nr:iron ABC transporter permease [Paramuribaculum sp.]MDE6651539.1 iron ABC transporter permease [Paramuribaculum sp.]